MKINKFLEAFLDKVNLPDACVRVAFEMIVDQTKKSICFAATTLYYCNI